MTQVLTYSHWHVAERKWLYMTYMSKKTPVFNQLHPVLTKTSRCVLTSKSLLCHLLKNSTVAAGNIWM